MRVITLNNEALEEHASRLAGMVAADGRRYDAIVGVRRGGSIVCDTFCRHFPSANYGFRTDVSLQRPSTRKKGGSVSKLLKKLPYWMLNLMRMAESKILVIKQRFSNHRTSDVEIPEDLMQMLKIQKKIEILLIDDAIDSGDTLYAIINTLRKVNPSLGVKVVVITVTTKSPRTFPDYYIYNNRTLIRFPWSNDYKTK